MSRRPSSRHPISSPTVARLSISLPGEDKARLETIAAEKKVSLAWVLRDAISEYLAHETQISAPRR